MNGRRRKDEPFNPFAPNASQKARDRKERPQRQPVRAKDPEPAKPTNDLAAKQKAAMESLRKRREIENEKAAEKKEQTPAKVKHKPSPQPKPAPKTEIKKPNKREDRLASLRAKSAATAQFAKDAKKGSEKEELVAETDSITVDTKVKTATEPVIEEIKQPIVDSPNTNTSKNIFKTIKTEIKKVDRRPKRRRPGDKKGGGRQPQSRKLDRRKYLEYKYAARELLENDAIGEEHRSNILGQIWAKGERLSAAEAIEFINQKEAELIIPEDVADEFRRMVKKYTTKR